MSLSLFLRKAVVYASLAVATSATLYAQTPSAANAGASYSLQGSEYSIAGAKPGDQVHPQLSIRSTGGYLVWQDNITDGYGWGVSAQRLDAGLSPALSSFRVNVTSIVDQHAPQVTCLNNGGAAFIWQSGRQGFQHIWGRFLSPSNTWLTGEVMISTSTNAWHVAPALATLTNGNVIATYAGINQVASNSMQDVFFQILTPAGVKVGGETLANQFTAYNQRNPSVAPLADGRFVVVWVSEQQRVTTAVGTNSPVYGPASVDVYGRIFTSSGVAQGNEFLINNSAGICSGPKVAANSTGGFLVVWAEQDRMNGVNGIDIFARAYSAAGVGSSSICVNTTRFGDQFAPGVAADASEYMVTWTGLAQDGSQEGVFGRFLRADGSADGAEYQVNTAWLSKQIQPAVAGDGRGRFLATWSSFAGGMNSFDLYAQRYVNVGTPLPTMDAPFVYVPFVMVSNVYQPQIQVSWPVQAGFPVDHYEVYVDGSLTATASVTDNHWLMTAANGLLAGTTHSFKVAFVTTSGRTSPLSAEATARTWSGNNNFGGIPSDWMAIYYGYDIMNWPRADQPVVPGGPTLKQIFLTGGNPLEPRTWLRTHLVNTPQGAFLSWNPQPGRTYQVQTSSNLATWQNLGSARFAAGVADTIYVGGGQVSYFRVLCLR